MKYVVKFKTVPNGKNHRFGKWGRFFIVDTHVLSLTKKPMEYVTERNTVFISEIVDYRNIGSKSKCAIVQDYTAGLCRQYNEAFVNYPHTVQLLLSEVTSA